MENVTTSCRKEILCFSKGLKMGKQTQKERFDVLLAKNGITQIKLFVDILRMNAVSNPYEKAQSNKANFNKMICGEREFPSSYIAPLEEILHTTYRYIKYGGEEDKRFVPEGIRYAAFIDDLDYYERLDSPKGNDKSRINPIRGFDEFGCSILDYILRYKSKNGLKYLLKKGYTKLYPYQNDTIIGDVAFYSVKDAPQKLLDFVFEIDDFSCFESFVDLWSAIDAPSYAEWFKLIKNKKTLQKIIESKNIWNGILSYKEITLDGVDNRMPSIANQKGLFVYPLVKSLCDYLLESGNANEEKTNQLLRFGIEFNQKAISWFRANFNSVGDYILDENGYIKSEGIVYGTLFIYTLKRQPDVSEETYRLMQELNLQINSFQFSSKPLLGGYSDAKARIIDGKIAKKSTNNKIEYKALDYFCKEGIDYVPKLILQKEGLDYFTYFEGHTQSYVSQMPIEQTKQMLLLLKKLNELSKKRLNDKVYVHGDLYQGNVVFDGGKIVGIIDWDSCHIGEEYEDLIYVLWTWLNIGDPNRNDEKIFSAIKECLGTYKASKELKTGWARKMRNVMEDRLAKTPKETMDYSRIFKWVRESEIWVELYEERITKEIG